MKVKKPLPGGNRKCPSPSSSCCISSRTPALEPRFCWCAESRDDALRYHVAGARGCVPRPSWPRKRPVDPPGGKPQLQRARLGGDLAEPVPRCRRPAQRPGAAPGAQPPSHRQQRLRLAQRQWRRGIGRRLAIPRARAATDHRPVELPRRRHRAGPAAGAGTRTTRATGVGGDLGGLVVVDARPERTGRPGRVRRHHSAHQRRAQRPGGAPALWERAKRVLS